MIVDNSNARRRVRSRGMNGLGLYDPSFLYSAPPGLVTFNKTPFVTQKNPDGSSSVTGGNIIYGSPVNQPASYVAPTLLGAPQCSSGPFGTSTSDACIAQLLQNEAHDLGLQADANYHVFLANCLNTFPQPTDCYQRTFGLTPAGGFTGSFQGDVPKGVNAEAFITGMSPTIPVPGRGSGGSGGSVAPPKTSQSEQTKQQVDASTKVGSGNITVGGHNISSIVDTISEPVTIAGVDIPLWGIGIAVVGGLVLVSKFGGGH